jgi:hypothetical protein
MKSLESSKQKRKSSEVISDVELKVASSLAQLGKKKIKTAMKKVDVAEVRRVPSAFDDDMIIEPSCKGFFCCLWRDLRFNFRSYSTPGSKNEFVDVESFPDDVAKVQKEITALVVAADAGGAVPQPSGPQDEASPEFTRDLEMTVHRGENPVQNVPLVETREDLPQGQDPSPSIVAFNKSFGTSYRGELLSVGCEMAAARDGASKLLTLWNLSEFMDETGERASEQVPQPLSKTARDSGKQHSTSLKKISTSSGRASQVAMETLSKKRFVNYFSYLAPILCFYCNF